MKNSKDKFTRKKKPIIALICEGRNKTETLYFKHFNQRENPYNLKIFSSESTDPKNMIKKAHHVVDNLELENKIGDRIFCLIDVDLTESKLLPINIENNKKNNGKNNKNKCAIEFILSNPCFEIWLLYYFTPYPHIENSSQNVKEQLKKYVPQYSENFDIIKENNLYEKHGVALNNADKHIINNSSLISERNPYTEVPELIDLLLNFNI